MSVSERLVAVGHDDQVVAQHIGKPSDELVDLGGGDTRFAWARNQQEHVARAHRDAEREVVHPDRGRQMHPQSARHILHDDIGAFPAGGSGERHLPPGDRIPAPEACR